MSLKYVVVLSAIFAVSYAVVSGDFHSVGVQGEQTVRGGLNTLSSYSKAVNTAHSQSYVSRTDYTSNPGLIAHPIAPVIAAAPAYHAPISAYHAPIAAYPAAAAYHAAPYPYAAPYGASPYGAYKAPLAAAIYH